MATLTLDIPDRLLHVDALSDTISVQEIVDQSRDFEDLPEMMAQPHILNAEGKTPLAGGSLTVITATLVNGWRLKFADRAGPTVELVTVTGGNLVGQDALGAEQFPIAPAAFTSATIAQATTGALLGSVAPEFQGGVWVDGVNGESGTTFPIGTPSRPVNNFADAKTIANSVGLRVFKVIGDTTCSAPDLSGGFRFEAGGADVNVTLTSCDVTGAQFDRLRLAGTLTGGNWDAERCHLAAGLAGVRGTYDRCELGGEVILSGDAVFVDSYSGVAGLGHAGVDANNITPIDVQFRRYTGGLGLHKFVTGAVVSIDLLPGILDIESDVTGGIFKVRGLGEPIVMSGTVDTLDADGFHSLSDIRQILVNRRETNPATGVQTIYDDDDVTPLITGNIWEDVAASIAYRGQGVDRQDRLS